jgi:hypothetical protein
MYRNATFSIEGYDNTLKSLPIHWVQPKMNARAGCPTFKTQKTLGSRALMSDDWTRTLDQQRNVASGHGMYHHRDGYNVLYGDWSARWYGDPQQRWMWLYYPNLAMDTYRTRCSFLGTGYNCLGDFTTVNYSSNPTYFYDSTQKCSGGVVQIWNALDQANGNDVSLPMTTP